MPTPQAIRWFKQTFEADLRQAVQGTPFTVDFLVAIACQETGYIWSTLQRKGYPTAQIPRLCVGDTIDGDGRKGRRAFPRNREELEAQPRGKAMFAIARAALEEMAQATGNRDYLRVLANPDKFCRGFGVFQYDLQHFKTDPDYFLEQRYADFRACAAKCIDVLLAAKRRVYPALDTLGDAELVHVGIAYNTGRFDHAKGLKQGYKNAAGRYYGEQLAEFLRMAQQTTTVGAVPAAAADVGVPAPTGTGRAQPVAEVGAQSDTLHPERLSIVGRRVSADQIDIAPTLRALGLGDAALDQALAEAVQVDVGALSRSRNEAVPVTLAADDLVAVKLANGATLWFSPEDFLDWEGIGVSRKRDGAVLEVTPRADDVRGIGSLIRAITFVARRLLDPLFDGISNLAEGALVARLEVKLLQADTLFAVDQNGKLQSLAAPPAERHWLLFLHGTQSSSSGSFAALWQSPAFRAANVRQHYAGVLAFEHRTLSASPAQNLAALAEQLPQGARLVVIGFSRGGLLGDLLARACPVDGQPGLDASDLRRFRDCLVIEALSDVDAEVAALRQAVATLHEKRIVVEWLLPVGAPLAGTTLASGKLSRLLSQLINLVNVAGPLDIAAMAGMQALLIKLLAGFVRDLVDFKDVPGLQAMNPNGALVRWLGSVRGRGWVSALKCTASRDEWRLLVSFAIDRIFERSNDWVVDTASMVPPARSDGGENPQPMVHALDVSAAGVHHLSYFVNPRVQKVLAQLCACAPQEKPRSDALEKLGFEVVEAPTPLRAPTPRAPLPPDAPILFILPGIMGTELHVGSDRVWLDKVQLLLGGMRKLAITTLGVAAKRPLEDEYQDLIDHFRLTHEVHAFGYDWRCSLIDAAKRLNERVLAVAGKAGNRPISFLAHSMGGLVVRAMMTLPDSAWPIVSAHPRSRFLMLGTPNAGSHAISQILTGEEQLLQLLAIGPSNVRELVGYCAAFPGVLDMLPEFSAEVASAPSDIYFDQRFWRGLLQDARRDLPLPDEADLQRALTLRRALRTQTLSAEKVYYVAGTRDETPVDVRVEPHWFGSRRIAFQSTEKGDGRVTWAHGIPKDVKHWYVDTVHGDLSSNKALFAGYAQILADGSVRDRRFSAVPLPRRARGAPLRSAGAQAVPLLRGEAAALPVREALLKAALGGARDEVGARPPLPRIRITVCCGDVRSAHYPVMVGHYRDDGLYSAERALNELLGNALQRSLDAGTYPREIGESKIFDLPQEGRRKHCTLVVGLGEFGLLSASRLVDTLAQAVTNWIEYQVRRNDGRAANISTVLIGTGTGGIDFEPALQTLLEAVLHATSRFADSAYRAAWPEEIEIMELYSDRSHRAWHALERLLDRSPRLADRFQIAPRLRLTGTGQQRAYYEQDAGWAQRVRVRGALDLRKRPRKLHFEVFSGLARISALHVDINRELVQSLLDTASQHGREAPDVSVALYNLLVPRDIKEARPASDRIVLIVNRAAAIIPWELLRPSLQGANRDPLSVQGGMVRQLSLPRPPVALQRVRNRRALVIADPLIGEAWSSHFGQLSGAYQEGAEVKHQLREAGYAVNEHEPRTSAEITAALYTEPCQILHIAAHGVFEWLDPLTREVHTGAVLEAGTWRPQDVEQLPAIPELVFINCCHLARIDGVSASFPQLAANLAQSFIALGARAVVAAGWAVSDGAALLFASTFYKAMLGGAMFIDAVRAARNAAYTAYPGDNTWGAYQCYGPDSYTLTEREPFNPGRKVQRHCTTRDLVLSTIVPATEAVRRARAEQVEDIVVALHEALAPTAFGEAAMREYSAADAPAAQASLPAVVHVALSDFYCGAGLFVPAARHAEAAWSAADSRVNTRMLTQIATAASRAALQATDPHDRRALMRRALEALPLLRRLPDTHRRLTAIAGVLRRQAMVEPTQAALADAEQAFAAVIRRRTREQENSLSDQELTRKWVDEALISRGPERAKWMSLEHAINSRISVLIVRTWIGAGQQYKEELLQYATVAWRPLHRGRFWRIAARAERLLLRTLIADMYGGEDLPGVRQKHAADRYARVLRDALQKDPGRDYIYAVRETLDVLEWFAPQGSPEAVRLQTFRRKFDEVVA